MASQHTPTQGTKLLISKAPLATVPTGQLPATHADWHTLGGTVSSYSRSGGQRSEYEVTTFDSLVVEKNYGLKDNGSVTISGNFVDNDPAQDLLRTAEESGARYGFRVIDAGKREARFLGVVTQSSEDASVNNKWNATFTVAIVSNITRLAAPAN